MMEHQSDIQVNTLRRILSAMGVSEGDGPPAFAG